MRRLSLMDDFLDGAERQAAERRLDRFPIFDADAHYMSTPWREIASFIEQPWRRNIEEGVEALMIPKDLGDRGIAGRNKVSTYFRHGTAHAQAAGGSVPPAVAPMADAARRMGMDYALIFPTDFLALGIHPQSELEVAIAFGYARWMTERVLPNAPSIKVMLYLPFSDPGACREMVEEFAGKPGVLGFMVTSVRYQPVNDNAYMPLYARLEREGLPLGFHSLSHWQERPFQQFNRFVSVHALGFPFYNMIQLTNLVMNGIPERFPRLKIVFFEAGIAWLPFIMYRLDSEYMLRSSEAPLLSRKPSQYIKDFYYTTQPLEMTDSMDNLAALFRMADGENRFLYASDFPHQDFDLPSRIYDLPFLDEEAKRKILGGNALRLFGLEGDVQAAVRNGAAR